MDTTGACPGCGQALRFPEEAGNRFRCVCGAVLRVSTGPGGEPAIEVDTPAPVPARRASRRAERRAAGRRSTGCPAPVVIAIVLLFLTALFLLWLGYNWFQVFGSGLGVMLLTVGVLKILAGLGCLRGYRVGRVFAATVCTFGTLFPVNVLLAAINLTTIVCLFLPASNAYFAREPE